YLAIVKGRWPLRTKTVRKPLFRYLTPDGERRVRVQQEGQSAISRITGRQHFDLPGLGVFSLVEVAIETGRTHQIRVHLADAGFPIVGDDKYGDFKLNKDLQKAGFARMFLHAWRLKIRHPIDGQELLLEAPRPAEFDNLVRMGLKQDGN
ncbi:MAG: RluA family pseudouridine synthase, partial [Quisquiliibacterium sp.]